MSQIFHVPDFSLAPTETYLGLDSVNARRLYRIPAGNQEFRVDSQNDESSLSSKATQHFVEKETRLGPDAVNDLLALDLIVGQEQEVRVEGQGEKSSLSTEKMQHFVEKGLLALHLPAEKEHKVYADGQSEKSSLSTNVTPHLAQNEAHLGPNAFHVLKGQELLAGEQYEVSTDGQSEKSSVSTKAIECMVQHTTQQAIQDLREEFVAEVAKQTSELQEQKQVMQDLRESFADEIAKQTSELRKKKQTMQDLRESYVAEMAEHMSELQEGLSDASSLSELHRLSVVQETLAGQQSTICADLAQLAKMVSSLAVGMGLQPSSVTALGKHVTENSAVNIDIAVPLADMYISQAGPCTESETLQSITARCQSALSSVQNLHQQVVQQCDKVATKIHSWDGVRIISETSKDTKNEFTPPSKEDVLQMINACRSLRFAEARLLACIGRHSRQLRLANVENVELPEDDKNSLVTCLSAQEQLTVEVAAVTEEMNRMQAEAVSLGQWSAVQEKLRTVETHSIELFKVSQKQLDACLSAHQELATQVSNLAQDEKCNAEALNPKQWHAAKEQLQTLDALRICI